ncbi:peptide chain release factor 1 [Sphingobacteriales bacterium UPWRP_1]|nr:peptide chain release factor 1 [Sphingobacteriales bacterium TSM_CSM]PSJ77034.1 peptide chain release factor 1 [Sphingobacteriales bacterium UPWRP_1]
MLDKLEAIKHRWEDIANQLADPSVMSDMKRYKQLSKDYKDLEPIVQAFHKYKNLSSNIESNKELLRTEKDPEFRDLAKTDLEELEAQFAVLEEEVKQLLIPKDPEDDKNAILEIRAGTGGDEAAIFAGDLYRMYMRYCEQKGWKTELMSMSEGSTGGFKEVIVSVTGSGVYGELKYESGVHRVQRVPVTESQGRVHTSAASVAVLPEAEEVDVVINPADLRVDVFRASGAGGQHVNRTESAVRITHIPTGVVAESQQERSQIRNREIAMTMLRSRIYEAEYQRHIDEIARHRKTLVSTGDRSAKIRTYNYPQGRITDHRIGISIYNLSAFMDGDIQEMIQALQVAENAEKLKAGEVL